MTTDNFCFYLQNRQIQTSQTGGQQYSDTSPFSVPWFNNLLLELRVSKPLLNLPQYDTKRKTEICKKDLYVFLMPRMARIVFKILPLFSAKVETDTMFVKRLVTIFGIGFFHGTL